MSFTARAEADALIPAAAESRETPAFSATCKADFFSKITAYLKVCSTQFLLSRSRVCPPTTDES